MSKQLFAKSALAVAFVLSFVAAPYTHALAASTSPVQSGVDSARGSQQPANLFGNSGVFSTISDVLLFIIGAVAVIMIVIGGLRYVLSGGDAAQVQSAKNTILYALVGVVVAILAYAIVNFVISNFTPSSTNGTASSSSVR